MKTINYLFAALLALLVAACATDLESVDPTDQQEGEISLEYCIEPFGVATKAPSYATTITHMRILVFYTNNILFQQIVIPPGGNAPSKLRLPWGQYYIVFAGNFPNLSVTPGVTTMNDLMVSMNQDPIFNDPLICVAPTNPYYYYKVPVVVQFGVVGNILATLTPVSSKMVFQFTNVPAYYKQLKADIHGIGKSLSLQGLSLGPSIRVIKTMNTVTPSMKDSTYTFSSIDATPCVRLFATDINNRVDSLDFFFSNSIMAGNSYKINFIFPSSPVISNLSVNMVVEK